MAKRDGDVDNRRLTGYFFSFTRSGFRSKLSILKRSRGTYFRSAGPRLEYLRRFPNGPITKHVFFPTRKCCARTAQNYVIIRHTGTLNRN